MGGLAGFPLACPPPPLSTVSPDPYIETRERRIRSRTSHSCGIMGISPLLLHFWHFPSTGGSEDFPLACPPPPLSTVSPALSPETRGGG